MAKSHVDVGGADEDDVGGSCLTCFFDREGFPCALHFDVMFES
jgi:hypothetical protein